MNDRSPRDYLPRHIDRPLVKACTFSPIVILDGPRGAGKTTTASRLAASVVNLPEDLGRMVADANGLLRSLPTPILIDEWQLAGTDLLWTLKRIVDDDPTPGQFLLAGSVEPANYGPTYPLTGRSARLVMRPMTAAELTGGGDMPTLLSELVAGTHLQPTAGTPSDFDIGRLFTPGFPATLAIPHHDFFLDAYAATTAQRAGDEGRDASRLMTTMRVLATLEGQAVPDQRIWESADINKLTWKNYADLLERAHITAPSPAFSSNRLTRLTSYPKRFLADTALALSLAGIHRPTLETDPTLAGRYVESFVMQQLRPQVDAVGGSLSHLRTSSGQHEIDAIIEVGSSLFAFEAKYGTKPGPADATHLTWLREQLGDYFEAGFVMHRGGDTYSLGDRIWAIPLERLC